ncbi:hypothetical protein Cob_v010214 [Colletotrichum orbiculare MAFF 240422]|uniref:Uncharacterized protein n=1 Tax=Colletotrichum orbiculare (strain 104-T / ATCC 96160 / CBS 514.97 / LARS 414 / MAFF 240422) TaxID=1213857 RepID=A0A484FG11_COLOR|nr:hypothetical protein Cob_v010214 [Colletotrichum orbiculare MAFF 240422]
MTTNHQWHDFCPDKSYRQACHRRSTARTPPKTLRPLQLRWRQTSTSTGRTVGGTSANLSRVLSAVCIVAMKATSAEPNPGPVYVRANRPRIEVLTKSWGLKARRRGSD